MFSSEELFIILMTLWSLWYFLSLWDELFPWRPPVEEEIKKRRKRRLKPQTPHDCELCNQGIQLVPKRKKREVTPWREIKHPAGRKKEINSEGKGCPHRCCNYYGITDANIHAVVSNGMRGKVEKIRQWKCQACGCKFSDRRNTPMYRLKTASKLVAQVMIAMAEGVDLSAATRIFNYHHTTVSRWLARGGQHGQQLHQHKFRDFICEHLQLDELTTRVKSHNERAWLWTAVAAQSKVLLVIHLGGRKKQDAQTFVHLVKERLAAECMPVFTSDGLRMYFYALTAHYGSWFRPFRARKDHWQVDKNLLYG